MTILELAFRHLRDHSVPAPLAQDILAHFAASGGRDIELTPRYYVRMQQDSLVAQGNARPARKASSG